MSNLSGFNNLNSKQDNTLIKVFSFYFVFVIIAGLVLQKIVIPATPWNAGNGLLQGGDWVEFNQHASKLADSIKNSGWSNWTLRQEDNALIGIMAFVYSITGISAAWVLLPISAILYGIASTVLFSIFFSLSQNKKVGILATLPLLILPSSAMIWGQIHKDIWMLPGSFLILFSCLKLKNLSGSFSDFLKLAAYNCCGLSLIWIVRPYANNIFFLGAVTALLILVLFKILEKELTFRWGLRAFAFLMIYAIQLFFLSKIGNFAWGKNLAGKTGSIQCDAWQQKPPVPFFDGQLRSLVCSRAEFNKTYPEAGSNVDPEVNLTNLSKLIEYLPRATQIGLLSPFPNMWLKAGHKPGARIMRAISGIEMGTFYALLLGLMFLLWRSKKRSEIVASLTFCVVVTVVYAIAIPNIGTLYRMRYPLMILIMGFGIWGWFCFRENFLNFPKFTSHPRE
jgi:hypothetical protein